jgi:hypothetical protein
MIRYMSGIGMGWHSDSVRLADRQGGYRMRLVSTWESQGRFVLGRISSMSTKIPS